MFKFRKNLSIIEKRIRYPDFLKIQIRSFKKFLDVKNTKNGLYKILKKIFPIINRKKNIKIDFVKYYIDIPNNTLKECLIKELTYNVNINIKLKITYCRKKIFKQKYYLCTCPYITNNGSFIFNGVERVIIGQLIRSPGIFFGSFLDKNGYRLYYSRIVPFKGSWIEIINDSNNFLYVYLDKINKINLITFLKAIGYRTKEDILVILGILKKVKLDKKYIGKKIYKNGKKKLSKDLYNYIKNKVNYIYIYKKINKLNYNIIKKNLIKDKNKNYKKSVIYLYKILKKSTPPDIKIATITIHKYFNSLTKYNLSKIGRKKINRRLKINVKKNILTKIDYKKIIKYFLNLLQGVGYLDDLDNLSNKQIKTVGDHLSYLFGIGLFRIYNIIKNKINLTEKKKLNIKTLINSKILTSILNTFFGTSQFSQFLDKTNPISEMTHKRRVTFLGPGGLTKSRASFEARNINYSHYGRICPLETPEGPNIGLIHSLSLFSNINKNNFLVTPYRKIVNGVINNKLYYLSSEDELNKKIGHSDVYYKKKKIFFIRENDNNKLIKLNKIDYVDYSPNQMLSLTASLIPFIEHNDPNRALMGSNMMRQTLPLLKLESPIVGTGMEKEVIKYSRNYINAKSDGEILYVDSKKIIVKYKYSKNKINTNFNNVIYTHYVPKFERTNQNTCFNLKPIVKKGDKIKKNQLLCEGFSNKNGELSLGKNLLVAFMSWKGYNFEDAIIVSNRVLKDDTFTSIHIETFSLDVKKIKNGKEELTRDLPNISEKELKKLDKNGIIKIGSVIKPGDILIGKIIPKEVNYITPEEKLLKQIFGEKASKVKEVSLKAPSYLKGVVIDVKIFENKQIKKKKYLKIKKKINKKFKKEIKLLYKIFVYKLLYFLRKNKINKNIKVKIIKNNSKLKILYKKKSKINEIIIIYLLKEKKLFKRINIEKEKKKKIELLIKNYNIQYKQIKNKYNKYKLKILYGNNLQNQVLKTVKVYVAQKRKLKIGDKMSGRHGNKGVIAKIVREEDMPFLEDGTVLDILLNPLSVPSRMNLGQILESILGYIGYKKKVKFATPTFDGIKIKDLYKLTKKYNMSNFNQQVIYDGISGEKLEKKVTIGVIYILKLSHMVDDKMHARSVGPYSLITQQPLGGKSQFGGQRFGEMEVWALEGYGASNILRELLTIKSDDIEGRRKTYEYIVRGKKLPEPNIPESFNVLKKELKGLCIDIKLNKKNVKK